MWETLSVAENREELKKEIETIEGLIVRAKDIINGEKEIKLKELKDTLEKLKIRYPEKKRQKNTYIHRI